IKDSGAISVVAPNVNATKTYLDLSNPDGKPPAVHHDPLDAKAYYRAWGRERHINTTSTTWTEYYDKAKAIKSTTGGSTNMTAGNMTSLTTIGNATKFQKYENSTYGIKMQNPSGWRKTTNSSIVQNATSVSTYENRNYGIQIQYPSDWTIQQLNPSGTLINIATFVSPTGPNSNPTADVSIYLDKLHNSTTTVNNYAHFVALANYENKPSYFHAFKLLELSTNSSVLAGKPAYTLIGTYQDPSAGLQKLMEVGTIIDDKAYSVQYIADAPRYSGYLPIVQRMINSLAINMSTGKGIGLMPDNSTNLYPDNLEKCYDGLCYIQWSRHLTAYLTVQKDVMNYLPVDQLISMKVK
ncbi:MAG: PsbP-related protein, partial [Candidatus Nitrosopolaris sp.]